MAHGAWALLPLLAIASLQNLYVTKCVRFWNVDGEIDGEWAEKEAVRCKAKSRSCSLYCSTLLLATALHLSGTMHKSDSSVGVGGRKIQNGKDAVSPASPPASLPCLPAVGRPQLLQSRPSHPHAH